MICANFIDNHYTNVIDNHYTNVIKYPHRFAVHSIVGAFYFQFEV